MIQDHCKEHLPQFQLQQLDTSSDEESIPEEEEDWSSDVSDYLTTKELAPLQPHLMAQEPSTQQEPTVIEPEEDYDETVDQPQPTMPTTSNGKIQTLTLDDIPPSKWRDRF